MLNDDKDRPGSGKWRKSTAQAQMKGAKEKLLPQPAKSGWHSNAK
jgi:hypothetical protein